VLAGEPERFESLVRKYTRLGGAIAFGILGDYQLAEDVVQEAFFKAFRVLRSLKEPGKFKVWFSGIVRSTALDEVRRRQARGDVKASQLGHARVSQSEAPDAPPLEAQVQQEARLKVMETIRELPEDDRMVIVLKYMEGLSYKEVAEIVGSSVSAVESRLFRARQVLKSKLMNAT
jgi:RNA polymerase sigma-70 factor (ECF subfamily)